MKKLMVLSLVLAMAGISSASYSLVAENAAVVDGAVFSIENSVAFNAFDTKVWAIVVVADDATLGKPNVVAIPSLASSVVGTVDDNVSMLNPSGLDGWFGSTMWGAFTGPLAAGTVLFDGITIVGDGGQLSKMVTVYLYEVQENVAWGDHVASAEVLVSMIPEPMTMGLLGLGALFLRRRK